MRPLTDTLPKPMAPVAGKPILERQLEWLREGGVDGVVFLAGYRWEAIQDHFGKDSWHGIRVSYSVEDSPLGRGGAIKQGYPMATGDDGPVVVTNGDIITRQPLQELIDFHRLSPARNNGPAVTLLSVPMVSPYGIVDMDDTGSVVGISREGGVAALDQWRCLCL